ncbi:hypothetical protein [Brachyspira aalborgi]|jgi:hypothetical protein|uniref:hypothetical protein n=1 Tax=Brachyspira aalborgi TaxID=29522 RepID=UPI000334DBBE|nr:hypothetical protein [Brachyspira aalborgi]MBS4762837.1 hypothetical protein [Brachyspira sp.]CCY75341.1 unknown [Brachyspira sp. CAG:700]
MEDKNNLNDKSVEEEELEFGEISEENKKLEEGWTVEHLMELCPSLTREEAERAHKMGW